MTQIFHHSVFNVALVILVVVVVAVAVTVAVAGVAGVAVVVFLPNSFLIPLQQKLCPT